MKLSDDIEALHTSIPNTYEVKRVLAAQIRLVRRHLSLSLIGAVFTSVCFFVTIFITLELNSSQKLLNTIWLT